MTELSLSKAELIQEVRTVFDVQSAAISLRSKEVGDEYIQALLLMKNCTGRVIVCGMGKSGHIGKKISASLASLGTPSFLCTPVKLFMAI
ncbi:hypothetical protein [Psychromonas sp. MME1]|uniref:hypothetical protein n=1 Tax=Psychromonas sp. MME1 TaxID=3231032 RepID=UPI0034E2FEC9